MRTIAVKQPSNDATRKHKVKEQTPGTAGASVFSSPDIAIQRKPSCPCGGGCPRCRGVIQPKLMINQPGDIYEQEADRIADQVMTTPAHPAASSSPPHIQRLAGQHAGQADSVPTSVDHALASPGRPLEPALRQDMEQRFCHDFSKVRVHDSAAAGQSAREVNANAYTHGNNIVFGAGGYAPGMREGRRLIAHELTHVVQQSKVVGQHDFDAARLIQRSPDPPGVTSMFIDPYPDLPLRELKKLAKTDPEAAESLRLRYRNMSDAKLGQLAARGDAMAKSVRAQRIAPNTLVRNLPKKGYGRFSDPGVYDELVENIEVARAQSGIPRTGPSAVLPDMKVEGGVVGAAKTNVAGLEDQSFVGRSKVAGGQVNPASEFAPATDPNVLPHTFGHAEQDLADKLSAALRKLPPESLEGRTVWMLIEQEPCATCASGIADPQAAAGVLRKLSEKFPDLTFEIKHLDSNKIITLRDGEEVVKRIKVSTPKIPPVPATAPETLPKATPETLSENVAAEPPVKAGAAPKVTPPGTGAVPIETPQGGIPKPQSPIESPFPGSGMPEPVPEPKPSIGARVKGAFSPKNIRAGLRAAVSAENIATMIPDVVLAVADKVAARDAIRRIQVKFAKEGFAKGYAAGVAGWSKEEVDSSLKKGVTHFRVKGLEDPAGLLKLSYILQIAEVYENYAVDLGYHRSSSKSQRWKENTLEWGFNALEKRNYYFNRNDDQVRFAYPFIDKFAWVLSPTTDQIVQQAIDEGDARRSTLNSIFR